MSLLQLDLHVATRTLQKEMRRVRPPRSPRHTGRTFLTKHAPEMWAGDFLPGVDLFFRPTYVFFLIELGSRRVDHFGVMRHPTAEWVRQHLREATPKGTGPKYLIRDHDSKLGAVFERVAEGSGLEIVRIPYRAPRANAVCECFVGRVRRECLAHLLHCRDQQLYRVIKEDDRDFNRARPHPGIGPKIPEAPRCEEPSRGKGKIIGFPGLKGLHHADQRAA